MYTLLVTVFFLCTLNLNEGKKANVVVTLHRKHIFSLFSEGEIWGIQFENKTQDIVNVEVVIEESKLIEITKLKNDMIMKFNIIHDDAEEAIHKERYRINNTAKWNPSMRPDIFFQEYRSWPEYILFIDALLLRFPEIASRSYMGQTIQGRDIPIIKLSGTDGGDNKPGFYIHAELHAREWLANAATMYILNALAERYGVDERITNILNSVNIYIAATINIDGYIYSWIGSNERMWRKNRRNNGDGTFGVDLNRNYDGPIGTWCSTGASHDTDSNNYCGTAPFSEPETEAVKQFISNSSYNIVALFDMHTTGLLIISPWLYTHDPVPPPFYDEFVILGAEQQAAVYDVHGVQYESIQGGFGEGSGSCMDHAFSTLDILSFIYEGRGPGFNPPPENIIPAGQEQLAGVLTVAESLIN